MNPYSYEHNATLANQHIKKETADWLHYTVDFPTAHPTQYKESNTVRGEYFQPKRTNVSPLAILVHGMGDHSVIPCQLLARALVKQGIACFILYLTFHSSRVAETIKRRLPDLTADEWFKSYQLSVIDIRQVVDWAYSRTELDPSEIATFGISLGGFVSAIAMGIDQRIKAGVFVVTGGNSEKITWLSKARRYRKKYQRNEAEYNQIQDSYLRYLKEVVEKGVEQVNPARQSFLTDPMTFAHYLQQRPVLMINALWDKYIPREAVLDFWQACGQPMIKWFPTGHSSIWLWYPIISQQVKIFLKSTLLAN